MKRWAVLLALLAVTMSARADVFLSAERLAVLKQRVADKTEPTYSAYVAMKAEADAKKDLAPAVPEAWYVPGFYVDPAGHGKAKGALAGDANEAYALALLYRMTGDASYAAAAAKRIDAWAGLKTLGTKDDSTLTFCYHFPPLIYAADLIRPWEGWTPAEREAFAAFLRAEALPMNTMARENNWGNWGLVLTLACAAYLDDEELLRRGAARWKEFIARQIGEDGSLPLEVIRNNGQGEHGIWYSHFCLAPQTIAAEILAHHGVDLYDYAAPNGRTLRAAFEKVIPWAADPATFPYYKGADPKSLPGTDAVGYWEILAARWPDPKAKEMLLRLRPLNPIQGSPYITFTHGEP